MIKIKVSGFKDQTIEFEQPNQALLFLAGLRQEHMDFLSPFIKKINKPNWFNSPPYQSSLDVEPQRHPFVPFKNGVSYTDVPSHAKGHPNRLSTVYREELKKVTSEYPLKVEITEFDDDMSDMI